MINPSFKIKISILHEIIIFIYYDVKSDLIEINQVSQRLNDSLYFLFKTRKLKPEILSKKSIEISQSLEDCLYGVDPRNKIQFKDYSNSNSYINNSLLAWKNQSVGSNMKELIYLNSTNSWNNTKMYLSRTKQNNKGIELKNGFELFSTISTENKEARNKHFISLLSNLPLYDPITSNDCVVDDDLGLIRKNTLINKEQSQVDVMRNSTLDNYIFQVKERDNAFINGETLSNKEFMNLMETAGLGNTNIPTKHVLVDKQHDNVLNNDYFNSGNPQKFISSGAPTKHINNNEILSEKELLDIISYLPNNDNKSTNVNNKKSSLDVHNNNINNLNLNNIPINQSIIIPDFIIDNTLNSLVSERNNIYNFNQNTNDMLSHQPHRNTVLTPNQYNQNRVEDNFNKEILKNKIRSSISETVLLINNKGKYDNAKLRGQIMLELNNFSIVNKNIFLSIRNSFWNDNTYFQKNIKEIVTQASKEEEASFPYINDNTVYKVVCKNIRDNFIMIDYNANMKLYDPIANFVCIGKHNNENKYKLELQVYNTEKRSIVSKADMIVKILLKDTNINIIKSTHNNYQIDGEKVTLKINNFNLQEKFLIGVIFDTLIKDYIETVKVSFRYINALPSRVEFQCGYKNNENKFEEIETIKKAMIDISFSL